MSRGLGDVYKRQLIASSIMSKKLAAGAEAIVLDVKVGDGAFMKTLADARVLATEMIGIGSRAGRDVTCLLTDMDQPLGRAQASRTSADVPSASFFDMIELAISGMDST